MFFILASNLWGVGSVLWMSWAEVDKEKKDWKEIPGLLCSICALCKCSAFNLFRRCVSFPLCTSLVSYSVPEAQRRWFLTVATAARWNTDLYIFPPVAKGACPGCMGLLPLPLACKWWKVSVSRQNNVCNEWAIIGKKMSIWLCQVCFLTFPLSEASPLENTFTLVWPSSCWLVQYCHFIIRSSIHPPCRLGVMGIIKRMRSWLLRQSTLILSGRQNL